MARKSTPRRHHREIVAGAEKEAWILNGGASRKETKEDSDERGLNRSRSEKPQTCGLRRERGKRHARLTIPVLRLLLQTCTNLPIGTPFLPPNINYNPTNPLLPPPLFPCPRLPPCPCYHDQNAPKRERRRGRPLGRSAHRRHLERACFGVGVGEAARWQGVCWRWYRDCQCGWKWKWLAAHTAQDWQKVGAQAWGRDSACAGCVLAYDWVCLVGRVGK